MTLSTCNFKITNRAVFMIFCLVFSFNFASCGDDDKPNNEVLYTEIIDEREIIEAEIETYVRLKIKNYNPASTYKLYLGSKFLDVEIKNDEAIFFIDKSLKDTYKITIYLRQDEGSLIEGPRLIVLSQYRMFFSLPFGGRYASLCRFDDNSILKFGFWDWDYVKFVQASFPEPICEYYAGARITPPLNGSYMDFDVSKDLTDGHTMGIQFTNTPWGLAYKNDVIYFCMFVKNKKFDKGGAYRIYCTTRDRQVAPVLNENSIPSGYFNNIITDIVADSKGNLYALESGKDCIYKIEPDKGVSVWGGSFTGSGYADGYREQALFKDMVSLKIDKNDNLYVAERTKIRKINPDGQVTTVAGTEESANISGKIQNIRFSKIYGFDVAPDNSLYIFERDITALNTVLKIINPQQTESFAYELASHVDEYQEKEDKYAMSVTSDGVVYLYSGEIGDGTDIWLIVPKTLRKICDD